MVSKLIRDRLWVEAAAGRAGLRVRCFRGEPGPAPSDSLEAIAAEVVKCTRCDLCEGRRRGVPGEGAPSPDLVFVGEAPGTEEDRQGRPFVGPAGQLLTRMIAAMGLTREQVFICNVLKCRPPRNRDPRPEEIAACKDYLRRQLALLQPRVVVPLGAYAARWLLNQNVGIMRVRGNVIDMGEYKVIPTLHPSYLLRRPGEKRKAWEDLQVVMGVLGLPLPGTPSPRGPGGRDTSQA